MVALRLNVKLITIYGAGYELTLFVFVLKAVAEYVRYYIE